MGNRDNPGHHGRYFHIRSQKDGDGWMRNKASGIGIDGQLPEEWDQVQQDPEVQKAVIFPSSQRTRRADRRRLSGQYEREP
jgi:hypothetical protein